MSAHPARFIRSDSVLSREVESALLLLVPGRQEVVSLSGAGPVIWALLREPRSMEELVGALAERFTVSPDDISADVRAAVDSLVAAQVVRLEAA